MVLKTVFIESDEHFHCGAERQGELLMYRIMFHMISTARLQKNLIPMIHLSYLKYRKVLLLLYHHPFFAFALSYMSKLLVVSMQKTSYM